MLALIIYALALAAALEIALFRFDRFTIDVGSTRFDPFLVNFRDPERESPEQGGYSFQWTRDRSLVRTPGLSGLWEISLRLRQRPDNPPAALTLRGQDFALRTNLTPGFHVVRVFTRGTAEVAIESDLGAIADPEARTIGVAVDSITLARKASQARLHPQVLLLAVLLTAFLALLARMARLARADQALLFAGAALAALAAAGSYAPYFLLGLPQLLALLALLIPLGWTLDWLLARRSPALAGPIVAVFVGSLLVKLAGALYPGYLPTDTLFHTHRFESTVAGDLYTTAFGQGQTYPYPPGAYLLVAPLALVVPQLRWLIPIASIAIDSSTVFLLAVLLRRLGQPTVRWACLLYAAMPVSVLVHWQGGFTQSVGQWFGIAALTLLVAHLSEDRPPGKALFALCCVSAVGHFGVFLNLGLMFALIVVALPLLGLRWRTLLAWPAAAALSLLVYYSFFGPLVVEQLGNLTGEVAGQGEPRAFLVRRFIWELGVRDHYQGVYLGLALAGLAALFWRPDQPSRALRAVFGAMLATSLTLGLLQVAIFFNPTRYLVFSYVAVASLAALVICRLDRRRWGWAASRALVGSSAAISLTMWASGFALDQRIGFLL